LNNQDGLKTIRDEAIPLYPAHEHTFVIIVFKLPVFIWDIFRKYLVVKLI